MCSYEIFADGFADITRANAPSTQNFGAILDAILLTFARGPLGGFRILRPLPVDHTESPIADNLLT